MKTLDNLNLFSSEEPEMLEFAPTFPVNFKKSITTAADLQNFEKAYKQRLITIAFFTGFLIPIVLIIDDLARGIPIRVLDYVISESAVIFLILFVRIWKQERFWYILICSIFILSFILSISRPNSRFFYFMIFYCSVPMIFVMAGSKKGLIVCAGMLIITIPLYFLAINGIIYNWTSPYTVPQLVVMLFTYQLLAILNWNSSRNHESHIRFLKGFILYNPVTKLPNRLQLMDKIKRDSEGFLAFLNCENQYELSMILGPEISDDIMIRIALALQKRAADLGYECYQLKDNEYALYWDKAFISPERAREVLSRLHRDLEGISYKFKTHDLRLHFRIGCTLVTTPDPKSAFYHADHALHSAALYREPVHLYDPEDSNKIDLADRTQRFSLLLKNQEEGTFTVFFQPIVDSSSFQPAWYEALLRLKDETGAFQSIFPFLPIAESSGHIPYLTRWVTESAIQLIKTKYVSVSINITLQDMSDKCYIDYLLEASKTFPADHLILEILERDQIHRMPRITSFLAETRRAGYRIALDDFGSGYSNFSTLLELPLDIVKLDGELVQKAKVEPKALGMVKSIVNFCNQEKLQIVAEHIDCPDLVVLFQNLGVHFLQGYHFSQPCHPDELVWE